MMTTDEIVKMALKSKISELNDDYDALITAQSYCYGRKQWRAYYVLRDIMDELDTEIEKLESKLYILNL